MPSSPANCFEDQDRTCRTPSRQGPLVLGPGGRYLCRYCAVETKPPRRTFCSDECVHQWKLRTNPGYLRHQTFQRDRGICAVCNVDTIKLQRYILGRRAVLSEIQGLKTWWDCAEMLLMRTTYGIDASGLFDSYWQADHRRPVCLGGGLSGLDNIRTLCVGCHKAATRDLAAQRAAARSRTPKDPPADSGRRSSSARRRSGR